MSPRHAGVLSRNIAFRHRILLFVMPFFSLYSRQSFRCDGKEALRRAILQQQSWARERKWPTLWLSLALALRSLALARVLWLWPWLALEGLAVLSVLFIGGLSVMKSPVHFLFSLLLLFCWFCWSAAIMGEREEMANALAWLALALALADVLWLWPWLAFVVGGAAVPFISILILSPIGLVLLLLVGALLFLLLFCWFCFRVGLPAVLAFLRWASGAELAFLRFSGLPHGWHWFLVVASACALLRWIARACAGSSGETPTVMATYDEWLAARDARPNPRQKKKYARGRALASKRLREHATKLCTFADWKKILEEEKKF